MKELIESFVAFYARYASKRIEAYAAKAGGPLNPSLVVECLNRGDCGVLAASVAWVYEQRTGVPVTIWDNRNHVYVEVDGRYYDSYQPEGVDCHSQMFGYDSTLPLRTSTVAEHHQYNLEIDHLGTAWVKFFSAEQKVPHYPYGPVWLNETFKELVHTTFKCHGFKDHLQPNGQEDFHPYVYNAAVELMAEFVLQFDKKEDY